MKLLLAVALFGLLMRFHQSALIDDIHSAIWLANDEFALDLLKKLPTKNQNNLFSPVSISAAFAMVSLGAKKKTLKEIKETFHFNEVDKISPNEMAIHNHFEAMMQIFGIESVTYNAFLANRLFIKEGFDITDKFVREVEEFYHVSVGKIDLGNGKAENQINEWIEKETHGKINATYTPNFFTQDTVLILVNAIYFNAKWKTIFNKYATKKADFYLNKQDKKCVQMMEVTNSFDIAEDEELKVSLIRMPYVGENLNMIIILPEIEELTKFVRKLTVQKFRSLLKKLETKQIKLRMPKFKLETTYYLKETLQKLNLRDLFSGRADLSGISSSPLQLSSAIHKSFIDINEKGTEAAAATGVEIGFKSLLNFVHPEDFIIDRPFFYTIVDRRFQNVMLFAGTVVNP